MDPEIRKNIAGHLILSGHYEEALSIFERLIHQSESVGDWNCYGTALLLNGDLEAAERAFRQTRDLPPPWGNISLDVGMALWCQGKAEEACADWQQELQRLKTTKLRNYDGSTLLIASLLWWASLRMNMPELTKKSVAIMRPQWKLEKKYTEKWGIEEWRQVIADWILGEITPEEFLLKAARTKDLDAEPLGFPESWHTTQCFFYMAMRYPQESPDWRADLESAVRYGTPKSVWITEFHIAKYELSKL